MMPQRSPLLIGNWKLHGTRHFVENMLENLKKGINLHTSQANMIVLPPTIFLQQTEQLLQNSPIGWGAQTMSEQREGAYTGEISGAMLKEFGCQYVLVGHSERRQYYGETNESIIKKLILAKAFGLIPILCIGETLDDYQTEKTEAVLQQQLTPLYALEESFLQTIILAYEPVWAIGTNLSATPEQAQSIHKKLRQMLAQQYNEKLACQVRILYGGSVKPDNAGALFAMPDVDGGLVGGASLNTDHFLQIYQAF